MGSFFFFEAMYCKGKSGKEHCTPKACSNLPTVSSYSSLFSTTKRCWGCLTWPSRAVHIFTELTFLKGAYSLSSEIPEGYIKAIFAERNIYVFDTPFSLHFDFS